MTHNFLLLKQNNLYKVNASNIIYIKGEGRYTTTYSKKGNFLTQLSLKKWRNLLPEKEFVQVNRNTLLKLDCIEQIIPKDNLLQLEDGTFLNISRHYKMHLMTQFVKII